jgi:alpha-glucosidase
MANLQIMKRYFWPWLVLLFLLLPGIGIQVRAAGIRNASEDSLRLFSPNGRLEVSLQLAEGGVLRYGIRSAGREVIGSSALGLEGWDRGLTIQSTRKTAHDTTWTPVYGERSRIRDAYACELVTLVRNRDQNQPLQIELRAYDEGIAFRYLFPEEAGGGQDIAIGKESTEFSLPARTLAWFTDHAQGSYQLLPLEKWPGEAERPLTLQLENGLYASLGEAEVVDYCRTKFILSQTKPNTITCSMYDRVELTTPFATPWRVIQVAEKATQLLEQNDIYLNLNPPCQIANTGWIKPGKVVREMTLSTKGAKELVDFAVKRHLDYIHFDAGWYGFEYSSVSDASAVHVDPRRNPRNDLDLQEVIRYAREHGIGVFLYVNQRALARDLDRLLPLYERWGVAGIKFGFVHVGSDRWTVWLHEAVKKCARYHLMVDIHDEYRPTGFSRTYPNLLTVEGVRGNEEMPDANHNTTLPFTRFLCGPADYTICYYHRPELKPSLAETQNAHVLKTTSMHQMALSVVYYSPLEFLYWYDKPEDSRDEPELEFFDRVPTVWDDTKVVDGKIGQFITVARRSKDAWFVGTITNNDARDLELSLSFLPPGQQYAATVYYDDPASPVRTHVSIRHLVVDHSTVLKAHLLPSGGQAIWIRPLRARSADALGSAKSVRFYVSPRGNDRLTGSLEKPFATVDRARMAAREHLRNYPEDSIWIYLRDGRYSLNQSILFDSLDSGHDHAPVIYAAYPGEKVSIQGGITVPPRYAKKVSDPKILSRLDPASRNLIRQVDLRKLGILDYGKIRPKGFGRPYTPAAMELFCNQQAMQLARWPNDSLVPIGKVLDPGSIPRNGDQSHRGATFKYEIDRPARWSQAKDIWIAGLFHYGYADDAVEVSTLDTEARTISTRQETMYGFESGKEFQRWFAFNLLEEIDQPGEYYIDKDKGILYFYPPAGDLQTIELSMVETPLVSLKNVSHVIFKNLTFECTRGIGLYIEGGQRNRVEDCTIRNIGEVGVCIGRGVRPAKELWYQGAFESTPDTLGSLDAYLYENTVFNRNAGAAHVVSGCQIYNTGSGGVSLGGGDRLTLRSGFNEVVNCRIHDFNRINRSYKAGVNIDGVGNIVRNCEIYRCPGSAIYLHGNNHTIELNDIHDAVTDGDDMGAIYYGRNPGELGNRVIHNYFHQIGNKRGLIAAVYHDDGACGMEVTGNVFYKAGSRTALIGGGNDNVYRNNIFIDCPMAFHLDARLKGWAKGLVQPDGLFKTRLDAVHFQELPYSGMYPDLARYFSDSLGEPKRNIIENNVFVRVSTIHNGQAAWARFGKNYSTSEDPGFVHAAGGGGSKQVANFALLPNSVIYLELPGFQPIPFDDIGPKKKF